MKNRLFSTFTLFILMLMLSGSFQTPVFAQTQEKKPYNENQDLRADLKAAIARASLENKHVLIQFGGNWCPWCLRFHALINGTPKLDSLMRENFVYLLLNVPKEKDKRDYALFAEYGYPNRFGFPVFVILDKSGNRLNTQDSDAFEHPDPKVKGYDTTKVVRFMQMWAPKALDPATYKMK
jgi:thioredoxin-related protein